MCNNCNEHDHKTHQNHNDELQLISHTYVKDLVKVEHANSLSLANFDKFSFFDYDRNVNIFCLGELWLLPTIQNALIVIPGYSVYCCV